MEIFIAAVLQFIAGALWYSPLMFGKVWINTMSDGKGCSPEEIKKMQKEMMPFYGVQFLLGLLTTWVFASNLMFYGISNSAAYVFAFFMWLGYMMPVGVSSVLWGNTKRKYWVRQILVMAGMQLVGIMIAAAVLVNF